MKKLSALCLAVGLALLPTIIPSQVARAAPPVELNHFEPDIRAYEARDQTHPPAPGSTLFVGSSTFALWGAGLEQDLKDLHAVNRGFGGSTIPEITYYSSRIVVPYKPGRVVFYAGTNDIAAGHSPEQVLHDYKLFVQTVRARLPGLPIAFISMSIPPSRVQFRPQYLEANRLIEHYCHTTAGLYYLDVSRCLLDAQGNPRPELFRADRLHMLPAGYQIWIPQIRRLVRRMPARPQG